MIQRIQTIFLALVAGIFIALFFIPVYTYVITSPAATDLVAGKGFMLHNPLLLIPLACISLLALITIFGYKNRKRQINMCRAGVIISMLFSLNTMVFPRFFMHGIDKSVLQFATGSYLLPVNIILFALAANSIRKDENLVRAADRLR
jgi:hypothetical protein